MPSGVNDRGRGHALGFIRDLGAGAGSCGRWQDRPGRAGWAGPGGLPTALLGGGLVRAGLGKERQTEAGTHSLHGNRALWGPAMFCRAQDLGLGPQHSEGLQPETQWNGVAKGWGAQVLARWRGFESWLYFLAAVRLWASDLTTLCLLGLPTGNRDNNNKQPLPRK